MTVGGTALFAETLCEMATSTWGICQKREEEFNPFVEQPRTN
jgi:hypothetical protein